MIKERGAIGRHPSFSSSVFSSSSSSSSSRQIVLVLRHSDLDNLNLQTLIARLSQRTRTFKLS
jgi:hypothetical protein